MVYMARHNRILLFGGHSDVHGVFDDTWLYDAGSNTWSEIETFTRPTARIVGSGIAYDSNNDVVILYGGNDLNSLLSDVWFFDSKNNTWSKITDSAPPGPAPLDAYMIYATAIKKLILFNATKTEGETWLFDFPSRTWTQLDSSGPSTRHQATVSYDSINKAMILFGGSDLDLKFMNETWVLSKDCTFGPENQPVVFIRGKGKPFMETITWDSCGGPGLLQISVNSVSSANIYLNGVKIASPGDFSKNVTQLEFEIELLEGDNTLQVRIEGKPGGYLGIEFNHEGK